ncbi:alpha/beta hydrolase [Sphingosinithalassobacter portus]|uniref:alpha/beta hydrolase n=1 Tax=Stakelama portus TaxID=2676234 RepID=UPI00137B77D5|nr:alpha/beta hydrolase [Sphingosinithalassobacter portus]
MALTEPDAAALPAGIAEYIAAVRIARDGPRPDLETARLIADANAYRIAVPRPQGMRVTDSFAVTPGLETPVRIYRPAGEGAQPAIAYFHGGGFTTGSIESYDCLAAALAEATGATVVSVHYMRLPEATPRAMIEQCFETIGWIAAMAEPLAIDASRLCVAGDSAGACIAAQLAILARDRGGPALAAQILCYGVFDFDETRPGLERARDPILTLPIVRMMNATWRECDARDPLPFPPPLETDDLAGLPRALLLGAERDPLLEQSQAYAERLKSAGVDARFDMVEAMPHGFLRAQRFSPAARDAMRKLGEDFRSLI